MTIGQRIREARKQAGLTQKELARLAGAAPGTIQQYELGKRQPRLEQLTEIGRVLKIPVQDFLEGIGQEEPTNEGGFENPKPPERKSMETAVSDVLECVYGRHIVQDVRTDSGEIIDSVHVYGSGYRIFAMTDELSEALQKAIQGMVLGLVPVLSESPEEAEKRIRREYAEEEEFMRQEQ